MATLTWRYDVVKRTATRTFVCRGCGKKAKKSTTFRQTINPFNKNAEGQVKTRAEIESELAIQVEDWDPDHYHDKCIGV